MHEALGLRSCGVSPTPLWAPNGRKKRSERALKLLFRLKGRDTTIGDENFVTYESAASRSKFLSLTGLPGDDVH